MGAADRERGEGPANGGRSLAGYGKLKPGPSQSPEEVAEHQRCRLRLAMLDLVAERGYEGVTVRELTSRAKVSRAALSEHFGGKRGCFLATYEMIARRAARAALAAELHADSGRERLRLGIGAFLAELAGEPRAAHFALVDCFSVWPESLQQMAHASGLFDAMLVRSVATAPEDSLSVPAPMAKAIVAGIAGVARERLLSGRLDELGAVGEELAEWSLALLGGPAGEIERPLELRPLAPPPGLAEPDGLEPPPPGDERALLLAATARLAAEEGFEQLSVPRIRAAAGVSRRSFDSHFEDATDCFLAAIRSHGEGALARALPAAAAGGDWPGAICETVAALCVLLAANESLARLVVADVFAPGPAGVRCRTRHVTDLAAGLRASAPERERPSAVAAEASVAAIWALVYDRIAGGRARRMPEIAGTLAFCALAPAIGAEAAAAAIRDRAEPRSRPRCAGAGGVGATSPRG